MKKYNLLALAACLWMTTACSDFLELNDPDIIRWNISSLLSTGRRRLLPMSTDILKDRVQRSVFDHDRCGDGRRGECLEYKRNQRIL